MPREATLLWNAVPWYIGEANRLSPTLAKNWHAAKPALQQLVPLLRRLEVVVLQGKKAERAERLLKAEFPNLKVFKCPHTGAQSNNHKHRREKVRQELCEAAKHLGYFV